MRKTLMSKLEWLRIGKFGFCFFLLLFVPYINKVQATTFSNQECIQCHSQKSKGSNINISIKTFKTSIHSKNNIGCIECHGNLDESHKNSLNIQPPNCNQCHIQKNMHGAKSKNKLRPKCYSCHSPHQIVPIRNKNSSVHLNQLKNTCVKCHPSQCGNIGYLLSFSAWHIASHPKANLSKKHSKYDCVGCHQGKAAHGEDLPLNTKSCPACHIDQTPKRNFSMLGNFHQGKNFRKNPFAVFVATLYQVCLLVLLVCGIKYLSKITSK